MAQEGQRNMTTTQNGNGSTTYSTSYTDENGYTHNVSFTTNSSGNISNSTHTLALPVVAPPGWDPTKPPGPGWEWRGGPGSKPGDPNGAWYNPDTGESRHPDLNNEKEGPHWDINQKGKDKVRVDPDTGEPLPTPTPTPTPADGADNSDGNSSEPQATVNINWGNVAKFGVIVVGAVVVTVVAHVAPVIIVGMALGVFD